jgi:membrane protein required for colicin V production
LNTASELVQAFGEFFLEQLKAANGLAVSLGTGGHRTRDVDDEDHTATFSLIAHVVSDQVRDSIFSGVDRALGLAFGLIRGLFVVAVVLLGIHNFVAEEKLPDWYKESSLAPIILKYSEQGLHEATKTYGLGGDGATKQQDGAKQDGQQQDGNKDGATSAPPHDGQHGGAAPNHPTPSNPAPNAPESGHNAPAAPAPTPAPAPAPAATPSAKPGYGIEERKRLDDLFTKKP